MRTPFQGIFILGCLALIIAGINGSPPLVITGTVMILLAVLGRVEGVMKKDHLIFIEAYREKEHEETVLLSSITTGILRLGY